MIKNLVKSKIFRAVLLGIIFIELISFYAWAIPEYGNIAFFIVLALIMFLSLQDIRYGVGIALIELIIGSHGYLLSFQYLGMSVSVRMGIFVILIAVGILHAIKNKRLNIYGSKLFWPLVLLIVAVIYASLVGVIMGNSYANIFFDANSFMFLALAIPIWQAITKWEDVKLLFNFAVAAIVAHIIKVVFLLYIFSHQFWWILPETYRWVRDTRIGEITQVTEQFFRVFFQSQIYVMAGFFIVLMVLAIQINPKNIKKSFKTTNTWIWLCFGGFLFSSLLISFSRSNWVGIIVAALCVPVIVWLSKNKFWTTVLISYSGWVLMGVLSIIIITSIVLFPYPSPSGPFSAGSLISKRALTISGEAGVSSRWQLLGPLWEQVSKNMLIGAGFGKTVTYVTKDPRILAQNPTGQYTTFVFEWGYLDLWLKFGLFGLFVYAYFVLLILKHSYRVLSDGFNGENKYKLAVYQGIILGGIGILVVHAFSPYLNHPLGIGYLLFWASIVDIGFDLKRDKIR